MQNSSSHERLAGFMKPIPMAWLGFVLGFGLIFTALVIDLVRNQYSFNVDSVGLVYDKNVAHWIILTSPLFLCGFFFVMGKMITGKDQVIERQRVEERSQFLMLEQFVSQLQEEKLDVSIPDTFKNKSLSSQLHEFRKTLAERKSGEERRGWENEGLAAFGELLRKHTDTGALAQEVLWYLVKYVSCNQGSIFILDEKEEALELRACYAYEKKKFVTMSVDIGQGLVGQCFLEKETILLYDVPKDYIKITSGLGLATPDCVVIVPLKYNDHVTGVLELASFQRLQKFEITFLEKCAQALASVLQATRVNENVRRLLEQSQQQMEQLRSQEEEIRQNMEEMQATQEQLSRQLEEAKILRERVERREYVMALTTILSETDLHGTITYVNDKFCEVAKYNRSELLGKPHNTVRHPDMPKELFQLFWSTIKQGEVFRGIVKNRAKDKSHYWVDATIVPIKNENGEVVKYVGSRYHIKDERLALALYNEQAARFDWPILLENESTALAYG